MIKYVQQKKVDYDLVKFLLENSQKSNQYTNRGPAKYELEKKLSEILELPKNKKVICVANGTLALHSIFLFLKEKYSKRIKMVSPSFTFPSCVVGGYNTSIVDIEMQNYTIPLTKETIDSYDCFIITNLFGTYPSNLLEWQKQCKENNKILILDNASSPLSKINGIGINNIGDFSFGSLHHTKFLGFGEGGFIVTDEKNYEKFNEIIGFGFETSSTKRKYQKNSSNYKISDINCAFIHQHIIRYDINLHKEIQNSLIKKINEIDGLKVFNYSEGVVYGNLPILYEENINHLYFKDKNIECNKYYYPLKRHKNSMQLYRKIVNLPLHSDLTEYEIDAMVNILKRSSYEYNNGSW